MRLDRGCDRRASFLPRLSARLISINGTGAISGYMGLQKRRHSVPLDQIDVRNLESIIEAARRTVVILSSGSRVAVAAFAAQ
jgi:hypothetical protein